MRILEYKIPNQIFVKAEITKLTPLPINNNSDNYYLLIPSVSSTLPDNVMFVQETLLIPPHTTSNYIPKIVKLGVTISESLATPLSKGIEIKIVILDNIVNEISALTDSSYVKAKLLKKKETGTIPVDMQELNNNTYVTDGSTVKVDGERSKLLGNIDRILEKQESKMSNNIQEVQSLRHPVTVEELTIPIVNRESEVAYQTDDNSQVRIDQNTQPQVPIKRGRGRPRKTPAVAQEALQSLIQSDE